MCACAHVLFVYFSIYLCLFAKKVCGLLSFIALCVGVFFCVFVYAGAALCGPCPCIPMRHAATLSTLRPLPLPRARHSRPGAHASQLFRSTCGSRHTPQALRAQGYAAGVPQNYNTRDKSDHKTSPSPTTPKRRLRRYATPGYPGVGHPAPGLGPPLSTRLSSCFLEHRC